MSLNITSDKSIYVFLKPLHMYTEEIQNKTEFLRKFTENFDYCRICNSLYDIQKAIQEDCTYIITNNTYAVYGGYIIKGYRIFVYTMDDKEVEISFGKSSGGKEIRQAHNLEKLLLAGYFGISNITEYEEYLQMNR